MPPPAGDHPAQPGVIPALCPIGRRILVVVASDKEARAAMGADGGVPPAWAPGPIGDRADLLITGVGKANAAGAVARALDPARHAGVLNIGICGSLPGGPGVCEVVLASSSVFADEGVRTPGGLLDCRAMGFPLAPGGSDAFSPPPAWRDALLTIADRKGIIATVSACSGTDAGAGDVASRTGAIAEAMEGAAVALASARVDASIPFAEVRVVSNTTGDRDRQVWALADSLEKLGRVLGRLLG